MIRKYLLPLLAVLGLVVAVQTVMSGAKPVVPAPPVADPARQPFASTIAGAGIVEARTQNIALGTPISGVVAEVNVDVGTVVQAGNPLFKIDDRDRRALLAIKQAALLAARADVARLESLPRVEDVPAAKARVATAEAVLADAKKQLDIAESLDDKRAMAVEEWSRRRFAVQGNEARLLELRADLAKLEAGAWKPDLDIARAKVASAESEVQAAEIELERLVVRAPVDCTVLQVNVRKGEFAIAGALQTPLMLLGDISTLHVRVDIDESDVWRLKPGARAEAYVRGNSDLHTTLEFVRVDPYVVPKKSLTGESTERVDTRVLQVLFRFDPRKLPVYVGQQMDVFIEAAPDSHSDSRSGTGARKMPDPDARSGTQTTTNGDSK